MTCMIFSKDAGSASSLSSNQEMLVFLSYQLIWLRKSLVTLNETLLWHFLSGIFGIGSNQPNWELNNILILAEQFFLLFSLFLFLGEHTPWRVKVRVYYNQKLKSSKTTKYFVYIPYPSIKRFHIYFKKLKYHF